MTVIDTDVSSLIHFAPKPDRSRLIGRLRGQYAGPICVSAITVEEQMRGWLAVISKAKLPAGQVIGYVSMLSTLEDYREFEFAQFTPPAAAIFTDLRRAFPRRGAADLKIAATAIAHDALLLSGNARDFAGLPGLRFEEFRR